MALWRPPALRQSDFVDMMKEIIVPQLVEDAYLNQNKRPASPSGEEPAASKPRVSEVLSVEEVQELISAQEQSWECLMSEYMKKKMSKELPHSNNPPDVHKPRSKRVKGLSGRQFCLNQMLSKSTMATRPIVSNKKKVTVSSAAGSC